MTKEAEAGPATPEPASPVVGAGAFGVGVEPQGETLPDDRGLYVKLAEVMAELNTIPGEKMRHVTVETRSGGSYSYDYITEATLMQELRPKLAARGIATFYSDEIIRNPDSGDNLTVVRVYLTFVDGATGEREELQADGYGTDYGDKGANKAKTSALRYLLWKTFLFASDLDPEEESIERRAPAQGNGERRGRQGSATKPATEAQKAAVRRLQGELDDRGVELNGAHVYDAIHVRTPVEDMTSDQAVRTRKLLEGISRSKDLALTTPEGQDDPLDLILGPPRPSGDFPPAEEPTPEDMDRAEHASSGDAV